MAIDDDKLIYSSEWDIDQLVESNTVAVAGSGTTLVRDYSLLNLPPNPVWEVQFRPTGSTRYYTAGLNSLDGAGANNFTFFSYESGNTIYIVTDRAGTARYFIWSDKVDY